MPTNDQPLVILCAMHAEADAIIAALGLEPADHPWPDELPPRLWRGVIGGHSVDLVVNGLDPRTGAQLIGTTPATLAAQLVIAHLTPSALLVAGAAGGCSQETEIGQVLLIERAYHHDRRIPLPEFADYAHGPEGLVSSPELAEALGARLGTISTGNALDTPEIDLAFFRAHGVTVKDMETASIAWVASLTRTPVLALRAITDYYDHPTPEHQFLANFDAALCGLSGAIARGLPRLIAGGLVERAGRQKTGGPHT